MFLFTFRHLEFYAWTLLLKTDRLENNKLACFESLSIANSKKSQFFPDDDRQSAVETPQIYYIHINIYNLQILSSFFIHSAKIQNDDQYATKYQMSEFRSSNSHN